MSDHTVEEIQAVEFAHEFVSTTLDNWAMAQGCSSPMEVDDGLCAMWSYVEAMSNFLDEDIQAPLSDDVLDFAISVIRDECDHFQNEGFDSANTLEKMMVGNGHG